MWPLLKTVIEAHNAVVVIALFDWRCGVPGPGDGSMDDPTYYGLSSEIRKSIERGFAPPDSPLAPHSALMHRRRLRQRATEEWKRLELLPTPERRQPPISTGRVGDNVLGEEGGRVLSVDDHQYQGSTPTVDVVDEQQARIDDERVDRNAKDMEDHHRNYFQNVGRPFFLDEQRRCPLAFGEKDTLQRAKDEVEWLRTWVENDGGGGARRSLQVLLNCDTPALACIRYWDRDEPLSFDLDFEKYRNTSAADLAATVRATRMSDNSAAEGRWGRTVLQAQDIERRARELLSLPETTQMRCVWLQDEATEELLAPPAEAPSSRILTENGVEHVLSDMLSRVK
ncbi:unnamed protein product [Amoebophrya sp. A25]|nr:unnamed protein product [Amoebophrya sp. A25]|eukprot:GSA25T00005344001.1